VGLFIGTNIGSYFYGRESYEEDLTAANIETVQETAVENAKRVEEQVTRIERATTRLSAAANETQRAIDENNQANLDPNCSTSDDELREFNELTSEASNSLSDLRSKRVSGPTAARE
jgi:chromosomal replication initiation ATPase DnaA